MLTDFMTSNSSNRNLQSRRAFGTLAFSLCIHRALFMLLRSSASSPLDVRTISANSFHQPLQISNHQSPQPWILALPLRARVFLAPTRLAAGAAPSESAFSIISFFQKFPFCDSNISQIHVYDFHNPSATTTRSGKPRPACCPPLLCLGSRWNNLARNSY